VKFLAIDPPHRKQKYLEHFVTALEVSGGARRYSG